MLKASKNKIRKIKQKRRRNAFLVLLLIILIMGYFLFRPKNYVKRYFKNDFEILETYNKELKVYSFEITKNDQKWYFVVKHSYNQKRKLIEEVELIQEKNVTCIIPKSSKLKTYPQCMEEKNTIDYHLIPDEIKEKIDSQFFESREILKDNYEKIDIKYLNDQTFYIWNYKGFYRINKKQKENIKLFEKDIYNINNIAQINEFLIIPDYQESYYFNKFYIINLKDGSKKTWKLKESIYFDGYYLGSDKNSLFYVDKKTKTEWEFLPKKKKMRKIGTEAKDGKILKNGEWEKISLNKLTSNRYAFEKKEIYQYEIKDGLYVKYLDCPLKKKISNQNVKEIVKIEADKIYYLADEYLYLYSEATGEILLMSYFEWNFNYKNMIFIQ